MEQVFLFVINALKSVVENSYISYILLTTLILVVVSYLVEIVLRFALKKRSNGQIFKSVSIICFVLSVVFSIGGLETASVFSSAIEVIYYNLAFLIIVLVLCLTLNGEYKASIKKQVLSCAESEQEVEAVAPSNVKRIVETITCKTLNKPEYSGYLNIDYLKELIAELKKSDLDEQDLLEVEELELYLLNFVTRQPLEREREVLSTQIGLLFKKLAKYNVLSN